jgi:hypothetical protein
MATQETDPIFPGGDIRYFRMLPNSRDAIPPYHNEVEMEKMRPMKDLHSQFLHRSEYAQKFQLECIKLSEILEKLKMSIDIDTPLMNKYVKDNFDLMVRMQEKYLDSIQSKYEHYFKSAFIARAAIWMKMNETN